MAQSFHQKTDGGLLLLRNLTHAGGLPSGVAESWSRPAVLGD